MGPAEPTRDVVSFGPFRLVAGERLLLKEGAPVKLGARTLDLLMALVARPNQAISKKELMSRVWPDVTVDEGSLRFHIAGLRKALSDGKDGARYVTTLPGRGYCFVAAVSHASKQVDGLPVAAENPTSSNLPARLTRMVGRQDSVAELSKRLDEARLVTIVGPGGVGKTTVAVALAQRVLKSFSGGVLFVDFGAVSNAELVAASLASLFGLPVISEDPTPSVIARLRDQRMLLLFDNCEHVVDGAASLAARILPFAPEVKILATSREALRVDGEQVYRLPPLAVPPEDPGLSAALALTFPATQLLVERAAANGFPIELSDADAPIVASICRKLDGMALAIELAAGRVQAFGLQQTAALLDQRLALLWRGQRVAPPRQQTLQATLDWSYGLLSERERLILRRLSVFVGHFTIEAALAIVTSPTMDPDDVFGAIDSLVAKSMVAARPLGAMMRYRLLDTTRSYVLGLSVEDDEMASLAVRHALYYQDWLEQTGADWRNLSTTAERGPYLANLENVRSALDWCFGASGEPGIGVRLAAAAAPVFLATSMLTECHRWSEKAISALDDFGRGGPEEMRLQAAFGLSMIFTSGESEAARTAICRSRAIAKERGDLQAEVQALSLLHMFHHRIGEFKNAFDYANLSLAAATKLGDGGPIATAYCLYGVSLHHMGDFARAEMQLQEAVRRGAARRSDSTIYLGYDPAKLAAATMARNLWLRGHPAKAVELARRTVQEAASMGRPVTLSIALNCAVTVFLWTGDFQSAEEHVDKLFSHAEAHSLSTFLAVGRGFRGELALRRGDVQGGVELLQGCLEDLDNLRYTLLASSFAISLAEGLTAMGRCDEAMSLVDERVRWDEANQALIYVPELFRIKGLTFLAMPEPQADAAEACLSEALDRSRRYGAPGWELRAALDLATLWTKRDRPEAARGLIQPLLARFLHTSDRPDLEAAQRLLSDLS